jgi:N-acetylglucosamine-6-sulfatase
VACLSVLVAGEVGSQPIPTVSLSASAARMGESGGSILVSAGLSSASAQDVRVPLSFLGTATQGVDYSVTASTIIIPAGATSASVTVSALDDPVDELSEKVNVRLGAVVNATKGSPTQVSFLIDDDDPVPKVSLSVSATALTEQAGQAQLNATLVGLSDRPITVPLEFTGTATLNSDYQVSATELVIPPGTQGASIDIVSLDDASDEIDERILIARGAPTNAVGQGPKSFSITIRDDDPLPTVDLSVSGASFSERGGAVNVVATLSSPSGKEIAIPLTFGGTAILGTDFSASGSAIQIAPGFATGQVRLDGIDDQIDELQKRVVVTMGVPSNARQGAVKSVVTAVTDDDPLPAVNLSASSLVLDEGGAERTIELTLSSVSEKPITVQLAFAGNASPSDFSISSATVNLDPGALSGTTVMRAVSDGTAEPSERLQVYLSNLKNASGGVQPSLNFIIPGADIPDERPNIVVLVLDDGSQELMDQGAVSAYFPHLYENLYRRGTYFPNYHTTTPLCGPSRASFLRGQFAHNTNFKLNAPPPADSPPGAPTGGFGLYYSRGYTEEDLSVRMKLAGYQTALVGKYLNNGYPQEAPSNAFTPEGWDDFYTTLGGGYFGNSRVINRVRVTSQSSSYRTDQEKADAVRIISEHFQAPSGRKPLFLYLAPFSPHATLSSLGIVAPRFADNPLQCTVERTPDFNESDISDKGAFIRILPTLSREEVDQRDTFQRDRMRSILATDELFGAVVEALGPEADKTYFFFTTDNGYFMGQHRIRSNKRPPYTQGVSAPLVVRGPGVAENQTRDHLLMNIDLLPTFLQIAGAPAPDYADGKSILPVLSGVESLASWRQSVLLENWDSMPQDEADEETNQYSTILYPMEYLQLRTADYSYIRWANGDREYYDFVTDPYQLDNSAGSLPPERIEALDQLLDQWATCAQASCNDAGAATPP